MKRNDQVPAVLDIAAFVAVFATLYGAICLTVPLLAVTTGSANANSAKSALLGVTVLAVCFSVFKAHDRARTRTIAPD